MLVLASGLFTKGIHQTLGATFVRQVKKELIGNQTCILSQILLQVLELRYRVALRKHHPISLM